MGGICGLVKWRGRVEWWELGRMAAEAGYRGVDGVGYWNDEGVGLASLRQWLARESYGEKGPRGGAGVFVTSDARLDNRKELIKELQGKGYRAGEEASDEELILKSYECWGERSVERLLGDFSFAVWDGRKRRLYGARDVMGMRPFYYREEGGRFLFASEIQQMLVLPGVPERINEEAVGGHLAGVFDDLELTFYEGIKQLPPGHAVVAEEGNVRTWRYWEAGGGRIRYRREEEYAEHFRELFKEAVRCRLRSVKPIGISLSGGMDSGSVASTAGWLKRHGEAECEELRAYCWAFQELKECDEREISDGIVQHYGLTPREIAAEEAWPLQGYPEHGPHRDEPYFGVYQALLEKTLATARDDGTSVLLSGDAGDEAAGMWVYDPAGLIFRGFLEAGWRDLKHFSRVQGFSSPSRFVIAKVRESLFGPVTTTGLPHCPSWISPDFARRAGLFDLIAKARQKTWRTSAEERRKVLLSSYLFRWLRWLERSHAQFSLAFSTPWTDRRIVHFILSVPQWVVHQSGEPKRLVHRAMAGIIPEAVRSGVRKRDPSGLFHLGMKARSRVTIERLISTALAGSRGYIDREVLLEGYRRYLSGSMPRDDFWAPLTLEIWLRQYWRGQLTRNESFNKNQLRSTIQNSADLKKVSVPKPFIRRSGSHPRIVQISPTKRRK